MKVFLTSCGQATASWMRDQLESGIKLGNGCGVEIVKSPDVADSLVVIDISPDGHFESLRQNPLIRQYAAKCVGLYEADVAPIYLRGLYSSAARSVLNLGRFTGLPYRFHELYFRNEPHSLEVESSKEYLFSFMGRLSHPVRRRLFQQTWREQADVLLKDTSVSYNHFEAENPKRLSAQAAYWDVMRRSKFSLCPRGAGYSSIRIFEAMRAGVAPVIVSDRWIPPAGPKWEEFALFAPERKLETLYDFLKMHEDEYEHRGERARRAYEEWFSRERYWRCIVEGIRQLERQKVVSESLVVKLWPLLLAYDVIGEAKMRLMIQTKGLVRKALAWLGVLESR